MRGSGTPPAILPGRCSIPVIQPTAFFTPARLLKQGAHIRPIIPKTGMHRSVGKNLLQPFPGCGIDPTIDDMDACVYPEEVCR